MGLQASIRNAPLFFSVAIVESAFPLIASPPRGMRRGGTQRPCAKHPAGNLPFNRKRRTHPQWIAERRS